MEVDFYLIYQIVTAQTKYTMAKTKDLLHRHKDRVRLTEDKLSAQPKPKTEQGFREWNKDKRTKIHTVARCLPPRSTQS